MKDILVELKGSMGGIIGSFVIGGDGEVVAQDMPDLMAGAISKVSKTLHHVTNVIKATKSMDRLTVDSETAKLLSFPANDRLLVVIAEKNINQPLFKLMSNMAVSKIREAKTPPAPKAAAFDAGKVCDFYDPLYGAAAKRLANIIGPKCGVMFNEGAAGVKGRYQALFEGLHFGPNGKPDMLKIRENAKKMKTKDELLDALDELLLSMLDSVKKTAGAKQEQKAMDEIQQIKSTHGEV